MTETRDSTVIVTGALGQDGWYLSKLLAGRGFSVLGTSHRFVSDTRPDYLNEMVTLDLSDSSAVDALIKVSRPSMVFHLGCRSSSSQLFDDPLSTSDINGLSVVRLLEAIRRHSPGTRLFFASSSEVFARSRLSPQDESTPFAPRNAYGAAKAFGQMMVAAYREQFGLYACSGVLFNHESPRRPPHYVTRKVTSAVARIAAGGKERVLLGDLQACRDWGYAGDFVRGMFMMLQNKVPEDFVLATGRTHSVADLCQVAFSSVGLDYANHVDQSPELLRTGEVITLVGNAEKARATLGWYPEVEFGELIQMMVRADRQALCR